MAAASPHVVIVGGGFAGLSAASLLARKGVAVTIVDKSNHHTFQPFLYQVATAGLSPGEIAAPIRTILKSYRNVSVVLGEVTGFDTANRRVLLPDTTVSYDYLLIAAGASHSYFGHDEWATLAPGLKTIEDALEIRRRILLAFELAENQARKTGSHDPIHIAIVGGGPTGVELAGTLAEVTRRTLASDFRYLDPGKAQITLIEGESRVLPAYPPELSRWAQQKLEQLGVRVLLSARVTGVEAGRLRVGESYEPATVTIWAAGVAASPLGKLLGAPTRRNGSVPVAPDLSVPGLKNVFVAGDLAYFTAMPDGKPLPGLAPVAIQEGRAVARNILRDLRGEARQNFRYLDKGTMAVIGRAAAIADIRGLHVTGFFAWLLWLFVHILYLVGFRNRVLVLLEWAWSYFTYQRSARLIYGDLHLPGFSDGRESAAERRVS